MSEKKARVFDINSLVEESKKLAAERTKANWEKMGVNIDKKDAGSEKEDSDSEDDYGPTLPPKESGEEATEKTGGGAQEDEEENGEDLSDDFWIPKDREVCMEHGSKAVSAIALDHSGQRLASGGYDYALKFWDFAGMDASFKSFRSFEPVEAHQIKHLDFNANSELLLIISGMFYLFSYFFTFYLLKSSMLGRWQAKVVTREGTRKYECPKGYPFIRDMANTKGHCAMLTSGSWHPKEKETFLTSSMDGTLRLWSLYDREKHVSCLKPRANDGRRAIPTSCCYDHNGRMIAAGCQDGSLQIWDQNKGIVRKPFCSDSLCFFISLFLF